MQDLAYITAKLNSRVSADELVSMGSPVIAPLVWALERDASTQRRRYAAYALGQLRDARAVNALTRALCRDETIVREYAAQALGSIADPLAVRPLIHALGDPTAVVRRYAGQALVKIGLPAVMPLIQELWDPRKGVHDGVVETLAHIGVPAVGALLHTEKYADGRVLRDAERILSRIGSRESLPRLVAAEARLTPGQRVDALERLLDDDTLTEVRRLCQRLQWDTEWRVRTGALSVLRELERRVLVRPCAAIDAPRELLRPAAFHASDPPGILLRAVPSPPPALSPPSVPSRFLSTLTRRLHR